jgi:hypothetical protein
MPDRTTELRLQRGAEHLHRLGPRAIAELLAEIGHRADCLDDVLEVLGRYRAGLTPELLRQVGGDRFPPSVPREVPADLRRSRVRAA